MCSAGRERGREGEERARERENRKEERGREGDGFWVEGFLEWQEMKEGSRKARGKKMNSQ